MLLVHLMKLPHWPTQLLMSTHCLPQMPTQNFTPSANHSTQNHQASLLFRASPHDFTTKQYTTQPWILPTLSAPPRYLSSAQSHIPCKYTIPRHSTALSHWSTRSHNLRCSFASILTFYITWWGAFFLNLWIGSLNVLGFKFSLPFLKSFLDSVDICCIQELWLQDYKLDLLISAHEEFHAWGILHQCMPIINSVFHRTTVVIVV